MSPHESRQSPLHRWWATGILLVAYGALFSAWRFLGPTGVASSAILGTVVLSGILLRAWRAGYFLTIVEAFLHAVVVLDLLLEGLLLPVQEGNGFWVCAGGFGAVLVAYRAWKRRHPCHCRLGLGGPRTTECALPPS